jgi:hypothetical protein
VALIGAQTVASRNERNPLAFGRVVATSKARPFIPDAPHASQGLGAGRGLKPEPSSHNDSRPLFEPVLRPSPIPDLASAEPPPSPSIIYDGAGLSSTVSRPFRRIGITSKSGLVVRNPSRLHLIHPADQVCAASHYVSHRERYRETVKSFF